MTEGVWVAHDDPQGKHSAVFEDDGRVGWAYLLDDGKIVTDVWLYNHGPAPESPLASREQGPPRNRAGFASPEEVTPVTDPGEVTFLWRHDGESGEVRVDVHLRGVLFGRLVAVVKPGWARMARRDGPCARMLEGE